MTPIQHVEAHAKVCREALENNQTRPRYTGPSLYGIDLSDAVLTGANLCGIDLRRTDLSDADLSWADFRGANLRGADLSRTNLRRANLSGVDLWGIYLRSANLSMAVLSGANLRGAVLSGANLSMAVLSGATLYGTDLYGADLSGATMPDGRTFEEYKEDPLAGICSEPDARKRAIAAWGNHTWDDCPLHEAHGWDSIEAAPKAKRILVTAFITLFDSKLLPKPTLNSPCQLDSPKFLPPGYRVHTCMSYEEAWEDYWDSLPDNS